MGKKKGSGDDDEKVTFLGRPKNNVTIGIVGLPNVGKSSFFNLLCKQSVRHTFFFLHGVFLSNTQSHNHTHSRVPPGTSRELSVLYDRTLSLESRSAR